MKLDKCEKYLLVMGISMLVLGVVFVRKVEKQCEEKNK